MKKLIFAFLVITGLAYSQTAWETQTLNGTVQYSTRITGLDTTTANSVKYTADLDISLFDRSKLITYFIKNAGDDVDTVDVSVESKWRYSSTTVYDTSITGLPSNGEAGYIDTLNVQTGTYTPLSNQIRLRVNVRDLTSSTSNGTCLIVITGTPIWKP